MKISVSSRLIAVITASLAVATISHAQSTWSGGATPNANFSATGNWDVAPTSGGANNLFFGGSVNLNPNNDITLTTLDTGINFNSGASTFTISGNAIRAGNVTNNSGVMQNILPSLRLNGSRIISVGSGGLFLGQPVGSTSTSARSVTKSGSGDLIITGGSASSGGSSYVVNSGGLVFTNSVSQTTSLSQVGAAAGISLAGTATLRLNNLGTLIVPGSISTLSANSIVLGGGVTIVSNGVSLGSGATLSGIGSLRGGLVSVSGNVAPGLGGIGTLSVSNLSFAASASITLELDRSAAQNADLLAGGLLSLGGTLNVTNIGNSLQLGDSFNLFDGTLTGSFSVTNLPSLDAGLGWDFSQFSTDGILSVASVPEPTAVALFGTGAAAAIWRARRRRR